MISEQQVKTINEIAEVILKDNGHIQMGRISRNAINRSSYVYFNGSGNAYKGFKSISISIADSSIILRMDLDPSGHYDCFRPNPHLSFFQAHDIDMAKNIVREMLKFSDNLRSGNGELILK